MNIKTFAFAAGLGIAAISAQAASVQIQATGSITNPTPGNGYLISLADGNTLVAAGSLVKYGYFSTLTDAQVTSTWNSYVGSGNQTFLNTIYNDFVQWSTNTTLNQAGKLGRTLTNGSVSGFSGSTVKVWVWDAATTNAATQLGIFTSPDWLFPTTTDPTQIANFAKSYAFNTNFNFGSGISALIGSEDANSFNLAAIQAVPEPGSALALLAVGSVLPRRRRKA
jgi:hypothetical protein